MQPATGSCVSDGGEKILAPVRWRWGVFSICLVALLIGTYKAWLIVDEPLLGTDAGFRVFNAHVPVIKIGNRVWLPFLQAQIWLYRLSDLPFAGLKLISVFYLMLGTMCLGLYWRRVLGASAGSTVLPIVAAISFSAHWLTVETRDLMQEPVGVALFFALLLIASSGRPLPAVGFALAAAALTTRDSYWIYLLVVTLVGLGRLPWSSPRRRGYAVLWAVPVSWLCVCIPLIYLIGFGRLPRVPLEWPLMYNLAGSDTALLMSSAASLQVALVDSRTLPVAAGVALAAVVLALWRRQSFFELFRGSEFAETTILSAPIALLLVYGLIWVVNPWQATPGNPRAAWPLLEISLAVAPLLIAAAKSGSISMRLLVATPIVAGLAAGLHPGAIRSRQPSNSLLQLEYAKLERLLADEMTPEDPSVCLNSATIWPVFEELAAPLFRSRKTWIEPGRDIPDHCDVLVVEERLSVLVPNSFRKETNFSTVDHAWAVYRKVLDQEAAP